MSIRVNHIRGTTAEVEGVTPAVAELGFDTTKKEPHIGDGVIAGGIRLPKKNLRDVLAPTQINANVNDYNPTGLKHAGVLRVTTDASRNMTGMVPTTVGDTTDGRGIEIYNAGSFNLVLQDQNASSTAANRFDLGGADITLAPKQSASLHYSTTLSRWELDHGNYGQAIADGAVTARKLAASAMGMSMINGTLVATAAGSALTIAIKTLAGGDPSAVDPVYVVFRNATAATGDYVVMTLTAATSVVVSSGSSLGVAANNTAFRIWVVGFNDAGTFRLGVINCLNGASIFPLAGSAFASSTAEGGAGAADNAQTFYTGTAVTTKAYTTLGFLTFDSGLASVGAWTTSFRIQLFTHGVPMPGQEVGRARTSTGASTTGTTLVPHDNTIPQITEGDEYITRAITPSSPANLLEVEGRAMLSSSAAANNLTASIFRDATADALAVSEQYSPTTLAVATVNVSAVVLSGTASATTFRLRCGGSVAGTTTFNGFSGGQAYNGAANSFLSVREIMT